MKKLFYLFLFVASVVFVACSENEGENEKKELHPSIVGSWKGDFGDGEYEVWTFMKNGEGSKTLYAGNYKPESKSFTYTLNGRSLSIHFVDWDTKDGSPDFDYTVTFLEDAISFGGETFYKVT